MKKSETNSKKHRYFPIQNFKKYLKKRANQGITNMSKLHLEIKNRGFKGSYATTNRYLTSLRSSGLSRHLKHVEKKPGEQAQVDWGSFGKITINGRVRKLYAFVYILSYSRAMYVEFTTRQTLRTLEDCHIHSFKRLGIPKEIVYDNMKTVVLRTKRDNMEGKYNPSFINFANYYGFTIYSCHPRWPQEKGKVEAAVKYLRNNFMQGRKFQKDFFSLEQLNDQVWEWLDTVAHIRIHATVEEKPIKLWQKEKRHLRFPKDYPSYQTAHFKVRYSTKDGTVQFRSNWYEIPIEYARRKLFIEEINNKGVPLINIYHENDLIASYFLSTDRRQWITLDKSLLQSPAEEKGRKKLQIGITIKKRLKKGHYPKIYLKARPLDYYNKFVEGGRYE